MNKIIFRGQCVDNNVWEYGDLIHWNGYVYVLPVDRPNYDDPFSEALYEYEVKPETVGQYINEKDIEGEDIYSGDIVDLGGFGEIKWLPTHNQWVIYFDETEWFYFNENKENLKVIGNKFDNPELLAPTEE